MKNIFKILPVALGITTIVSTTSCSSFKHSYRLSEIPEKSVVIADKIGVELTVDENKVIQASSSKRHRSPNDAKDEAYFNAIVNNNIHVLVDPIYKTETTARILIFGGKSTSTVTGFAGYYKNPKSFKKVIDELAAEKIVKEQEAFDFAIKQMKQLKDDGIIKASTSTSVSSEKTVNLDKIGKLQSLEITTLNLDTEYELTKTTQTSSLVDEYNAFLKGVENPSSVGVALEAVEAVAKVEVVKKAGLLSKLMFWKKK